MPNSLASIHLSPPVKRNLDIALPNQLFAFKHIIYFDSCFGS